MGRIGPLSSTHPPGGVGYMWRGLLPHLEIEQIAEIKPLFRGGAEVYARTRTFPPSLRPVGRWRQWPRGWAAPQAAGPESGGGRGWRRAAVRSSAGRAGGACPCGDAAPRPASARRPIVRRSSRSASSWVRQARRRTLVARKAEVREDAPDDAGILDRGDQAHAAATVRTGEDVHRKDPLEQLRPAPAPRRRSA